MQVLLHNKIEHWHSIGVAITVNRANPARQQSHALMDVNIHQSPGELLMQLHTDLDVE